MESAKLNPLILVALVTAMLGAINFQSLGDIVETADLFPADRQLVDKQAGELAPAPQLWHQLVDRPTMAGLNPKPINTMAAAGHTKKRTGSDGEITDAGRGGGTDLQNVQSHHVDLKHIDPEQIPPKPEVPLILQSNTSNCGLASLAMLLSYHLETPVSLASLEHTATTLLNARSQRWKDEGYSVGELQSLARVYGLSIRATRVGVAELPSLSFPLLAWIDFGTNGHFTVVQSFERGEASLADPTRGYLKLGKAMWERLWLKGATGIVLYVE